MLGGKGRSQKGFNTVNVVLEAISSADREAAEANKSRYLHQVGVLKCDQAAEASRTGF